MDIKFPCSSSTEEVERRIPKTQGTASWDDLLSRRPMRISFSKEVDSIPKNSTWDCPPASVCTGTPSHTLACIHTCTQWHLGEKWKFRCGGAWLQWQCSKGKGQEDRNSKPCWVTQSVLASLGYIICHLKKTNKTKYIHTNQNLNQSNKNRILSLVLQSHLMLNSLYLGCEHECTGVCTGPCVTMWSPVNRSRCAPHYLAAFYFETGNLTGPEHTWVGQASWPVCSRNSLVSTFPVPGLKTHTPCFLSAFWGPQSGLHAHTGSTISTALCPFS